MAENILFKNAILVDPLKTSPFTGDIRITGDKIDAIAGSLPADGNERVYDVTGKLLMPGLVDIHVHLAKCPDGHHMLARAGVTTALEVAGTPDEIVSGYKSRGAGLTLGYLYALIPGETVSGTDPQPEELETVIQRAMENGAMGVKILGGHYPLTRRATQSAIEIAGRKRYWIAVHAGTVETPGDICGFEELIRLAGTFPVHIVHVNSFCRGSKGSSPLDEAKRAIDALKTVPRCCSESYLAIINGTSGALENGVPKSAATRRCLLWRGYSADAEGMKKAILEGWAKVHYHDAASRNVIFPPPNDALNYYLQKKSDVFLSFEINSLAAAISIALVKNDLGEFIVNALATDGGELPRNITVKQGLLLAQLGAMTLNELAYKACLAPARLLGLNNKGLLKTGADADIIVINPATAEIELAVVAGKTIMERGIVKGSGGSFICRKQGMDFFQRQSIPCLPTEPKWLRS